MTKLSQDPGQELISGTVHVDLPLQYSDQYTALRLLATVMGVVQRLLHGFVAIGRAKRVNHVRIF